ncbi:MAG: hypothetical protein ACRDHI_13820 [Actinomycetota bacterium]
MNTPSDPEVLASIAEGLPEWRPEDGALREGSTFPGAIDAVSEPADTLR